MSRRLELFPRNPFIFDFACEEFRHGFATVQMPRREILVLLLIMAVAGAMRLCGLPTTPPGLYPDEATNGNDAIRAWESGDFRLFYPNNSGREGLYINLQAISVHFLGNSAFALRLVSAVVGILTVLGTCFLTRAMFKDWRLAAIAAFLIATGFWHVNFSRIGFRAIMCPLMAVWGFYFLYRGFESRHFRDWGLAGLFFGLGLHTYIAFRVMPVAILFVVTVYWFCLRSGVDHEKQSTAGKPMLRNVATLFAVMLLVTAPLAVYFAAHPDDFLSHTARRSVFNEDHPVAEIANNIALELGMFVVHGDQNWRHNLPSSPILFWPVGILFALGLLLNVWQIVHSCWRNGRPAMPPTLLLSWFFIGLAPTIVSNEGMPHALRSLLVSPAVYIMAAQALYWPYQKLTRKADTNAEILVRSSARVSTIPQNNAAASSGARRLLGVVIVVLLLVFGVGDALRYFKDWRNLPIPPQRFPLNPSNLLTF